MEHCGSRCVSPFEFDQSKLQSYVSGDMMSYKYKVIDMMSYLDTTYCSGSLMNKYDALIWSVWLIINGKVCLQLG